MKTYIVEFLTNYGLRVFVINAETEQEAREVAENNYAWQGYQIVEVCINTRGLIYESER